MEICENMTNLEHLEKGGENHSRMDFELLKPPLKELAPDGVISCPPPPRQNHGSRTQRKRKDGRRRCRIDFVFGTPYQVTRSTTAFNPKHTTCVIRGFPFEVCPIR